MQLVERYRPHTVMQFCGLDKVKLLLSRFAVKPYSAAFLFTGQAGLGKTTMALALFEQIRAELHHIPSRSCDLETVERVITMCHYHPMFGGDFHGVLVDEADQMSRPAQHVFLSLLDATAFPPNTVFVFTSNDTSNLEDRFVSRCRKLRFTIDGLQEPATQLMRKIWLAETKRAKTRLAPPDFAAMLRAANFSVRDALMTLETEILCPSSFQSVSTPDGNSIYSIGHQGLAGVPHLAAIADALHVNLLLDIRTAPQGAFNTKALETALGERYQFSGARLGCGAVRPAAIDWLVSRIAGQTVMLMDKAKAPGNSHRHFQIAIPLLSRGIDMTHIYEDQLVRASALQTYLEHGGEDGEYEYRTWTPPKGRK